MSNSQIFNKVKTESHAPIFPAQAIDQHGTIDHFPGITKREYFAAMAMQGIAAEYVEIHKNNTSSFSPDAVADFAVLLADKLIDKLNKKPHDGNKRTI